MNSNETKIRKLKVYYAHHGSTSKQHPFIRLAGKYLSQFDFKIGDEVELSMEAGKIVITKLRKEKSDSPD